MNGTSSFFTFCSTKFVLSIFPVDIIHNKNNPNIVR